MKLFHTIQNFFDDGEKLVVEGLDAAGHFVRAEIFHNYQGQEQAPTSASATIIHQVPGKLPEQNAHPEGASALQQGAAAAGLDQAQTPEHGGQTEPFLAASACAEDVPEDDPHPEDNTVPEDDPLPPAA